ncbi:MAG: methyltransferase domain-containing protein [Ignavibacterium sp.]|nr:methyltransferase domain-containing protein [Ignavibacterium sp.]
MQKTDYAKIAATYNNRYVDNYLPDIETSLKSIIESNGYKSILEVGCGTGRWISSLEQVSKKVFGLDYSFDMMKIPKTNKSNLNLVNADAVHIPFKDNFFDLIFCVNAIHHFPDKEKFIAECKRTLTNNGMLAVFGVDPLIDKDWYVYDYFESVYAIDLKRFPSLKSLKRLLKTEEFAEVEIKTVEQVRHNKIGNDVFNDPFLEKYNCSQLADLSDEEYQKGIEKIKNQIVKDPETVFKTSVVFYLVSAKKIKEVKNANCN